MHCYGRTLKEKNQSLPTRKPEPLPEPFWEKALSIEKVWWSQRDSNKSQQKRGTSESSLDLPYAYGIFPLPAFVKPPEKVPALTHQIPQKPKRFRFHAKATGSNSFQSGSTLFPAHPKIFQFSIPFWALKFFFLPLVPLSQQLQHTKPRGSIVGFCAYTRWLSAMALGNL